MDFWTSLQVSIASLLLNDIQFERLCADRYYFGEVDDTYAYPYVITYGEMTAHSWMSLGNTISGENLLWPFYIVCDLENGGARKIREIMEVIEEIMHLNHFSMEDWKVIKCRRMDTMYPRKERADSTILRAVLNFMIMLERSD